MSEESSRFDELQETAARYGAEIRVTIYPGGAGERTDVKVYRNIGLTLAAQLDLVEVYLHGRRHEREDEADKAARHLQGLLQAFEEKAG